MILNQDKAYLAYLLEEKAKVSVDPSSEYFLRLVSKYIQGNIGITGVTTTFMHPGYKVIEVSLIETGN